MKIVVPFLLILSHDYAAKEFTSIKYAPQSRIGSEIYRRSQTLNVALGSIPWPVEPFSSTTLQCQGDPSSCSWRVSSIMFEDDTDEITMIDIIDGNHDNFGHSDASTGECDLLIEKVYPHMSGSFDCISKKTLEDGTVTEEILENYNVISQELSDFYLSFDDQRYEDQERIRPTLEKNETYEFVCGVTATPPPNIKWIFNNTRDITAVSVLTQPDSTFLSKYISTLTLETSEIGEQSLACVISMDYVTQEQIISVNFVVADIEISPPILSFDGKTYNDYDKLEDDLPLDQTYEFQCEVERAFPEPTIKWLHSEEGDVTEYSEIEVVQSDSGSSSYTNTLFFNVTTKGEQSLQCVVTHQLISDKETVTLFFNGGSATIGVSSFSLVSVLVLVVMPTYLHY